MDNNMLYWIIEYVKVLFGYGFLMFVWPLAVFRGYLKNKSVTFKFSFCVTAQVVIINTVVLLLGLLHILNDWTLRIVFYGTFLYAIRECFALTKERKTKIKYLVHGSYGFKNFVWLECRKYVRKCENVWARFTAFYKKHWLEYSLLIVAVVYGVLYFSWGLFHDRVYGFSDMNVHNQWVYQLSEGNAFSSGIYPEGMHCLMYALNALFGIRIYSCMLFVPSVNLILTFVAVYCLMKELFHWRLSAIFGLVFMVIFGGIERYLMISMARVQCALPQEIAFPAILICCLYLLRYLKWSKPGIRKGQKTKWHWDENLVVFSLALAATIAIHFYATFMAFFWCVGIAVVMLRRIFTKERFVPLVAAVMAGVLIAAAPMVTGVAAGIRLQGSLYWAMSLIENTLNKGEELPNQSEVVPESSTYIPERDFKEEVDIEENQNDISGIITDSNHTSESIEVGVVEKITFTERVKLGINKLITVCKSTWIKIRDFGIEFYDAARVGSFKEIYERTLVIIIGSLILLAILRMLTCIIIAKIKHIKINKINFSGYYIIIVSLIMYALVFVTWHFGVLAIIEQYRIGFLYYMSAAMVVIIPLDLVFVFMQKHRMPKIVLEGLSLCAVAGIVAIVVQTGNYHSYLYYELIRYDSVVQVTNKIIDNLPEKSFTIVSPTEELYQVIEYGWHEELLDFILGQEKEEYTLPTEYVFLYVEKKPLRHAQYHFHNGPTWLAANNYRLIYGGHSVYPEYLHSEISRGAAERDVYRIGSGYDSYKDTIMRTTIESKAFEWCEKFEKLYPNELKVFYEDDYLLCYYFKQNPQRVYNLSLE